MDLVQVRLIPPRDLPPPCCGDFPPPRKSVHFPDDADLVQVRLIPPRALPCWSENIGAFGTSALLEALPDLDGSPSASPLTPVLKSLDMPFALNSRRHSRVVIQTHVQVGRSKASVSDCDRAEGSRTCGGLIVWQLGWLVGVAAAGRTDRTSLSVNMRKAPERREAQLDGDGVAGG
ncbi:uncharacterized protein N7515_009031 [Penicillium bovifimosum]|uniref:Uncharacterized protein n=1 Tax=Penicillium bovifimosum TaxID=126998 RepID=A0A9W9KVM5_9EURO|nr:uncharacterized protein N7515_009031 [Penicillium bovifimosum]KAJ5121070.1 hypothetical protein N7515_009031 [Penicillium bovifimosum]